MTGADEKSVAHREFGAQKGGRYRRRRPRESPINCSPKFDFISGSTRTNSYWGCYILAAPIPALAQRSSSPPKRSIQD